MILTIQTKWGYMQLDGIREINYRGYKLAITAHKYNDYDYDEGCYQVFGSTPTKQGDEWTFYGNAYINEIGYIAILIEKDFYRWVDTVELPDEAKLISCWGIL